jgi:hypothetical protein
LTYFDNIHRHGQLEKLKISGYADVSNNGNLPRLADLRQWLKMTTSAEFIFEMNLSLIANDDEHLNSLLAEYPRVIGEGRTNYYGKLSSVYPAMSLVQPEELDDDDSNDESMNEDVDDSIDTDVTVVRR